MKRLFLYLCLILLAGCSFPSAVIPVTPTATYTGCYFNWATQTLPELTTQLDASLKTIHADASAQAIAFGEDCVYADGSATFGAMQTDFYIRFAADDLNDREMFGNWIAESMRMIDSIPPGQLAGPNKGFVQFTFTKSETESIVIRIQRQTYPTSSENKTGEELFNLFYNTP